MKVDEQGYRAAGEFEVCHYGGGVNAFNTLDGLQLDDHNPVHKEVQTVSAIHSYPSIRQRYRFLPLDRVAALYEFPVKTCFVAGFEQSRSKLTVYLDSRPNDGPRQFVDVHSECSERSVVNSLFENCTELDPETMPAHALSMPLQDL